MSMQTQSPPAAFHVLVVDDDPTIREAIAEYLSQHEFRVTTVGDGQAMEAVLAREVVHLVVLDSEAARRRRYGACAPGAR